MHEVPWPFPRVLNHFSAMAATPQPTPHAEPSDFIANVPLELAHVLLRQCADFRSASSLLCLNRHWAIIALDDSSWQPLAVLIAKEACLHYVPVPPSCWRSDCEKLFANRGTFVDTFGGCTAPPPPEALKLAVLWPPRHWRRDATRAAPAWARPLPAPPRRTRPRHPLCPRHALQNPTALC